MRQLHTAVIRRIRLMTMAVMYVALVAGSNTLANIDGRLALGFAICNGIDDKAEYDEYDPPMDV